MPAVYPPPNKISFVVMVVCVCQYSMLTTNNRNYILAVADRLVQASEASSGCFYNDKSTVNSFQEFIFKFFLCRPMRYFSSGVFVFESSIAF